MAAKRQRRSGGLGKVAKAAARQGGKHQWLKLDDGDLIRLRVLDAGEDFKDAYIHRTPIETEDGKEFHADVPCLDQDDKGNPCPGCKDDLERRYKFWTNVIVRDWEDESGEESDAVMIWSGGITVAKMLDKMAAKRDLALRDIELEREGSTMKNTRYSVDWADDEDVPLTKADKKLAEKKADLTRYIKPPEFDDFYLPPSERGKDDDDKDVGTKSLRRGSAFKKRDKEESGVRSTASRKKKSDGSLSGFGKGSSSSSKTTVRRRRSR